MGGRIWLQVTAGCCSAAAAPNVRRSLTTLRGYRGLNSSILGRVTFQFEHHAHELRK